MAQSWDNADQNKFGRAPAETPQASGWNQQAAARSFGQSPNPNWQPQPQSQPQQQLVVPVQSSQWGMPSGGHGYSNSVAASSANQANHVSPASPVSSDSPATPVNSSAPYTFAKKYDNDRFQKEVISLDEGYHIVLAPPGCGKTDILAERVVRALSLGVAEEDMLCLTFTNRAARGMRERILLRLGRTDQGDEFNIFVGNIHRFCAHYLFKNRILPANVTIIDEQDTAAIIRVLAGRDNEENEWEEDIMVAQGANQSANQKKPKTLERHFQMALELQHTCYQVMTDCPIDMMLHPQSLDEMGRFFKFQGEEFSPQTLIKAYQGTHPSFKYWDVVNEPFDSQNQMHILQLAKLYAEYKQLHQLIDFDDLLVMAYAFASASSDTLRRYKWIQIDETQDLSPFQFGIVDLFTDHSQKNVTLYLGDEQQAIFSFLGAKLSTLSWLKERCGQNIHHLYNNYRSPKYLLDVYNTYARAELRVDPSFLPVAKREDEHRPEDLAIRFANDKDSLANLAAFIGQYLNNTYPQERLAVLVNSNADADLVSQSLNFMALPHFKISGTDLFTLKQTKLLLAHLSVLQSESKTMAWSRLLTGLRIFKKTSQAQEFLSDLTRYALLPSDLLNYPDSSYMLELRRCYQGTYVIFDTETTGLDVFTDDIVQIAALKIQGKDIVDTFNVILETNKQIPAFLGDLENPLVKEYASREHMPRKDGFRAFLKFVGKCPLIGHNVEYDYHILDNNMQRDCGYNNFSTDYPIYFDTLKIARLLRPGLRQYKLKFLLEELKLQGKNSHLADDDIVATQSVLNYMMGDFELCIVDHTEFLQQNAKLAAKFRDRYAMVYQSAKLHLYQRQQLPPNNGADSAAQTAGAFGSATAVGAAGSKQVQPTLESPAPAYAAAAVSNLILNEQPDTPPLGIEPVLVDELKRFTDYCIQRRIFKPEPRLKYIFDFLTQDVIKIRDTPSLYEQLNTHMVDITTFREADLCESSAITERIFVSTVHKAKGLEFESVIIFDAVDSIYPNFYQQAPEQIKESARLFYVAMTRAKKRLIIIMSQNRRGISKYGKPYCFEQKPTRFLKSIQKYFDCR